MDFSCYVHKKKKSDNKYGLKQHQCSEFASNYRKDFLKIAPSHARAFSLVPKAFNCKLGH